MTWFRRDDPIEEELESHLRMAIEERIARGESPADAERNARRELGNLTLVSQVTREQRLGPIALLDRAWQETRVTIRSLLAARAFTLGTVGCWALAIAAHGAMLAIMDQIFVRPPAHVRDPGQVVRLYRRMEVPGRPEFTTPAFVFPAADALRRDGGRFAEFAAYGAFEQTAELPSGIRGIRGSAITRNYFSLLGVSPLLGTFPSDGTPTLDACSDGAVISHALWTSAFGGKPSAVGMAMRVGDRSLPVCAVAPAGFTGGDPTNPEVWVPVEVAGAWAGGPKWREYEVGKLGLFNIVARSHWFANANAVDLAALAKPIVEPFDGPMPPGMSRRVTVIAASLVPGRAPGALAQNRTIIWLGGAATLLLLLATLNVSTMLLLRTLERQAEFALRRVLGASRGTIARYVTLEVIAIGIAGAAVGLFFAQLLRPVLQQLLGVDAIPFPLARIVAIEGTALLIAGAIASLPPILAALSVHRSFAYRNDPRSTTSARAGRTRTALLVLQVASCVVLVAGALVMGASLKAVRALDLGLDASRVLVASLDLRYARSLGKPTTEALIRELAAKVAALSGVRASAVTNRTPFGMAFGMATFDEQRQLIKLPNGGMSFYTSATHGFFDVIGATVTRGRVITQADEQSAARVVVVNASFAGIAYPGSDPVGRCIFLGSPEYGPCFRIVGVIADQRRFSVLPEEPMMELYMPESHGSEYAPATQVILRTDGDPAALAPVVERIARSVFPPAAPIIVQPLARRLDPQVRPWIAGTRLLGIYSVVAFVVATAGIFGTLAYLTRLARRATAIRMALGASQLGATLSVARTGIATTLAGLAIGAGAALALRTQAGTLLFGIERIGLVALVTQAMLLVGVAGVAASLIPAWRGSRVDVFRSLNAE